MLDFRQLDGTDAKEKEAWERVSAIAKDAKELDELFKICSQHVRSSHS